MTGERIPVEVELELGAVGVLNGEDGSEEDGSRSRKSSIDSCGDSGGGGDGGGGGVRGQPSSKTLLIKMANDYSQYLKTDLSLQITKVEEFVVESIAKLEEFQSLYEMKEGERKAWSTHVLPDIVRTGTLLSITLNQRLDTLSCLILSIQSALDTLEAQISKTELKLGLPSPGSSTTSTAIRSVFKYFYKTEETGSDHSLPRNKSLKASSIVTYQQLKGADPLRLSQFFH